MQFEMVCLGDKISRSNLLREGLGEGEGYCTQSKDLEYDNTLMTVIATRVKI